MVLGRHVAPSLAALLLLTGCAAFRNTPAQDRVWTAYSQCRAEGRSGNVVIMRVDPDGRYWYENRSGVSISTLQACMAEKPRG